MEREIASRKKDSLPMVIFLGRRRGVICISRAARQRIKQALVIVLRVFRVAIPDGASSRRSKLASARDAALQREQWQMRSRPNARSVAPQFRIA